MIKHCLILFFYISLTNAIEIGDSKTQATIKKNVKGKKETTASEQLPDKELLLFLSEFTDAQGDWVDPDVFNQTINSNTELEETQNEDRPNNL